MWLFLERLTGFLLKAKVDKSKKIYYKQINIFSEIVFR